MVPVRGRARWSGAGKYTTPAGFRSNQSASATNRYVYEGGFEMLDVETAPKAPNARSTRMVHITPTDLRSTAARMEELARNILPGESVICEITRSITAVYKPDPIPASAHVAPRLPDETI